MRLGDLDELLTVMSAFEPIVQGRHDGMGLVEHGTWAGLCEIVKDAPTVDAVPVVRCKDCKHLAYGCQCYHPLGATLGNHCFLLVDGDDDYCSCGERKGGDGNDA